MLSEHHLSQPHRSLLRWTPSSEPVTDGKERSREGTCLPKITDLVSDRAGSCSLSTFAVTRDQPPQHPPSAPHFLAQQRGSWHGCSWPGALRLGSSAVGADIPFVAPLSNSSPYSSGRGVGHSSSRGGAERVLRGRETPPAQELVLHVHVGASLWGGVLGKGLWQRNPLPPPATRPQPAEDPAWPGGEPRPRGQQGK